jgi:hypothetical protein
MACQISDINPIETENVPQRRVSTGMRWEKGVAGQKRSGLQQIKLSVGDTDSLINRPHALTEFLGGQMLKSRLKSHWESVLFNRNGKPKRKLTPEGWFAYCVQKAGGVPQLAAIMGVSRQTVHGSWKGRFPDKHVVQAEKAFGIPRAVLAPHLFE